MITVWAPAASKVELESAGVRHPLAPAGRPGWWQADVEVTDYAFRLDDGEPLPDPRSLWQPYGIIGPSRVYDHSAFEWTDTAWRGVPLSGSVLYELHTGTFTTEGTFDAAIERLDYLRELGITTIELMPVAAFPGQHGWGYDGVNLWAAHEPYGGPDGLKRFVDAAHARGLAVLLDVVYNHVGAGNRLADFGPYFTQAHSTPWGAAVNLDQPGSDEVRAFLIGNALMWLRDFHLDGLRLDAVHALVDSRAVHFLEELSGEVRALEARLKRELTLIAESDLNDPRMITASEAGGQGLDAQWSDDFHHAVHAVITGERDGYYTDFASMAALAKTYTRVFFHDGIWSSFRGRTHGRPVDVHRTPGDRFLGYLQDHDQIGNRAVGDRITAGIPADLARVAAGLVLTAPFTPMLFMGEEWAASTPWQYFTDHIDPELARAVAIGRRKEFAEHGWATDDVPDPQDEATFLNSKLDWSELDHPPHAATLAWYRELIALRQSRPELTDARLDRITVRYDEQARWLLVQRGTVQIAANLSDIPVTLTLAAPATTLLAASRPGIVLPASAPGIVLPAPGPGAVLPASGPGTVLPAPGPAPDLAEATIILPPVSLAVVALHLFLVSYGAKRGLGSVVQGKVVPGGGPCPPGAGGSRLELAAPAWSWRLPSRCWSLFPINTAYVPYVAFVFDGGSALRGGKQVKNDPFSSVRHGSSVKKPTTGMSEGLRSAR